MAKVVVALVGPGVMVAMAMIVVADDRAADAADDSANRTRHQGPADRSRRRAFRRIADRESAAGQSQSRHGACAGDPILHHFLLRAVRPHGLGLQQGSTP